MRYKIIRKIRQIILANVVIEKNNKLNYLFKPNRYIHNYEENGNYFMEINNGSITSKSNILEIKFDLFFKWF